MSPLAIECYANLDQLGYGDVRAVMARVRASRSGVYKALGALRDLGLVRIYRYEYGGDGHYCTEPVQKFLVRHQTKQWNDLGELIRWQYQGRLVR